MINYHWETNSFLNLTDIPDLLSNYCDIILFKKKLCITRYIPHFKYHFFLLIPNFIFNFDTALVGSIQNLTINMFGNLTWKSVKLHYSVKTKILEFLKFHILFHGFQNSVLFLNPYSRD